MAGTRISSASALLLAALAIVVFMFIAHFLFLSHYIPIDARVHDGIKTKTTEVFQAGNNMMCRRRDGAVIPFPTTTTPGTAMPGGRVLDAATSPFFSPSTNTTGTTSGNFQLTSPSPSTGTTSFNSTTILAPTTTPQQLSDFVDRSCQSLLRTVQSISDADWMTLCSGWVSTFEANKSPRKVNPAKKTEFCHKNIQLIRDVVSQNQGAFVQQCATEMSAKINQMKSENTCFNALLTKETCADEKAALCRLYTGLLDCSTPKATSCDVITRSLVKSPEIAARLKAWCAAF